MPAGDVGKGERVMRAIDHYLADYAAWLVKNHPGPRWAMRDALRRNFALWAREYGSAVVDRVRKNLTNMMTKVAH